MVDHAADALAELAEVQMHYDEGLNGTARATTAQVHATLALVEQQRIANLIALADHAHARFKNYAGEAGGIGAIFSYGDTPESNMRLRHEIAKALGLGGSND